MTDPTDIDADDALAGELSLRVLPPGEEAAARARAVADPGFARRVDAWDDRLARMADGVAPVQPDARTWPAIERRMRSAPANDAGKVAFWRGWAVASTGLLAASLGAVGVLAARPAVPPAVVSAPPTIQPARVAMLKTTDGGAAVLTAAFDPNTGDLMLAPAMPAGARVPHLWLVMPDQTVHLVGVVGVGGVSHHHLTPDMARRAATAAAFAVSMEAPGHTPAADKPDGPVVAAGEMVRL